MILQKSGIDSLEKRLMNQTEKELHVAEKQRKEQIRQWIEKNSKVKLTYKFKNLNANCMISEEIATDVPS